MFDPRVLSYKALVEKFFSDHACEQRSDGRPQYINAIWYKSDDQKSVIDKKVAELKKDGKTVNTRIAPVGDFYKAEEYHQKYIQKQVKCA